MMPIYSPGCQKSTGSKNPNVSLSSYGRSAILTHFDVRNSSKNYFINKQKGKRKICVG